MSGSTRPIEGAAVVTWPEGQAYSLSSESDISSNGNGGNCQRSISVTDADNLSAIQSFVETCSISSSDLENIALPTNMPNYKHVGDMDLVLFSKTGNCEIYILGQCCSYQN